MLLLTNKEDNKLYINLTENEPDNLLKILRADGDQDFLYDENNSVEFVVGDNEYISHNNSGTIKILKWENDELTFYQGGAPTKTITLTDGKLNINMATLNKD